MTADAYTVTKTMSLPAEQSPSVGIVANPSAARDIRRLVADGAAVTTNAKINILKRVLAGLGSVGVKRVISMADTAGISAALVAFSDKPSAESWPELSIVDQAVERTAADSANAVDAMVATGVGAIVVLGGDGTNRAVASRSGAIPLVSISTGTNNAFPLPVEPTVAGIAAGLVAAGRIDRAGVVSRAKKLIVECDGRRELALVDVAISAVHHVGSGAIWDPTVISELFLAFAEPDAIGLSSIGGHLQPVSRETRTGLAIRLGSPARWSLHAPIAPGLVPAVDVAAIETMTPGEPVAVSATTGVIAVDGERLFRFDERARPTVALQLDGPVVIDPARALAVGAETGALARRY